MSSLILKLAEGQSAEGLDCKTFQVHVRPGGVLRLYPVTIEKPVPIRQDTRCPVIIGGERCGCEAGHEGKHMWAGGD